MAQQELTHDNSEADSPNSVVEVLGRDLVEQIELQGIIVDSCHDLLPLQNPHDIKRSNNLSFDENSEGHLAAALRSYQWVMEGRIEAAVASHAASGPVIGKRCSEQVWLIGEFREKKPESVVSASDRIEKALNDPEHDPLAVLGLIEDEHKVLVGDAAAVPVPAKLKLLAEGLEAEDKASWAERFARGARTNTKLYEKMKSQSEKGDDKAAKKSAEKLLKIGGRDKVIQFIHRGEAPRKHDRHVLQSAPEFLATYRILVRDLIADMNIGIMHILEDGSTALHMALLEAQAIVERRAESAAEGLEQLAGIEAYIVEKAKKLEAAYATRRLSPNTAERKNARNLMQTPMKTYLRRVSAANQTPGEQEDFGFENDAEFLAYCKVAKEALRGGAQLDYPGASDLASAIYAIKDRRNHREFSGAEVGIIIASLNRQLDIVRHAVEAISQPSSPEEEEIVARFKAARSQQYLILKDFAFKQTVSRLIERVKSDILLGTDQNPILSKDQSDLALAELTRVRAELMGAEALAQIAMAGVHTETE